jgi:ABC-type branched-subunit amino acid transport system ATPase component
MRIHSLTIQGFGPFKDKQEIDFDALSQDKIFMLEGPTGAGKSSVMLALFRIVEPEPQSLIEIDGVDITSLYLHQLRSKLTSQCAAYEEYFLICLTCLYLCQW